jgi:hypothetical protein
VQGQDFKKAFEAAQPFMKGMRNAPIVTGFFVAGLAHPDYLLEVDAIAYL